jgi:hypothetical protein
MADNPYSGQPSRQDYTPSNINLGASIVFSVVLVAFVIAFFLGTDGSLKSKAPAKPDLSWIERDDSFGAFYYTKEYVKLRLKAPSTAQFPDSERDNTSIHREGQVYTVVSWVDSQNLFGAMLRTVYACRIEQVREGVWQLRELSFFK